VTVSIPACEETQCVASVKESCTRDERGQLLHCLDETVVRYLSHFLLALTVCSQALDFAESLGRLQLVDVLVTPFLL
jgi:hypothetical protein